MKKVSVSSICILCLLALTVLPGCEATLDLNKMVTDSLNSMVAKAGDQQASQPGQPAPAPDPAPALQTVKVSSAFNSVNVRQDPSKTSPVVTALPGGMEVAKVDENDSWVKVQLDMQDGSQTSGWISKSVLEKDQ